MHSNQNVHAHINVACGHVCNSPCHVYYRMINTLGIQSIIKVAHEAWYMGDDVYQFNTNYYSMPIC
jgi:hypothetical protein